MDWGKEGREDKVKVVGCVGARCGGGVGKDGGRLGWSSMMGW